MRKVFGATAALALVSAMAATPASALVLTFKVDVKSVNDDADFTPFSFEETWTWDPTYTHTTFPGEQQDLAGPATVDGPSLVTDAQASFAQVDLTNPDAVDSTMHYIPPNTFFFALRSQASSSEIVSVGEKGSSDDVVREGLYMRGISLPIFGTETFTLGDISDEAQVRAFLTGRALTWSEFAGYRLVTEESSPYTPYVNRTYLGTATLVSDAVAVPEPGTWALMIAGFGAAGVALRRRVALAA